MLSCALIGTGRIGFEFENDPLRKKPASHLGAIKTLHKQGRLCLTGLCDVDTVRLNTAKDYYSDFLTAEAGGGFYKFNVDFHNLSKADIYVVATPPETHLPICEWIITNKTARLIFLEKPMCSSYFEAQTLNRACKRKDVSLAINYTRRWDPTWQSIKQIIDEKHYGCLTHFIGQYSGLPRNVGVHMADLCNWFKPKTATVVNIDTPQLLFMVRLVFDDAMIDVINNGRQVVKHEAVSSRHFTGVKEYFVTDHDTPPTGVKTPLLRAYENLVGHLEKNDRLECIGIDGVRAAATVAEWK